MKVIVRSLVIALAVTGAIATSVVSATPAKAAKTSAFPAPTCPPNSPTGCGLGGW